MTWLCGSSSCSVQVVGVAGGCHGLRAPGELRHGDPAGRAAPPGRAGRLRARRPGQARLGAAGAHAGDEPGPELGSSGRGDASPLRRALTPTLAARERRRAARRGAEPALTQPHRAGVGRGRAGVISGHARVALHRSSQSHQQRLQLVSRVIVYCFIA